MIQYDNSSNVDIYFRIVGSVLPGCVPVAMVPGLIGLMLAVLREFDLLVVVFGREDYIAHPFAIRTCAVLIGLLVAMRTNMALERYMTGIEEIQTMLSKWSDAFIGLSSFFSGKEGDAEQLERILLFRVRVAHWFSLMSCLAFATVRARHLSSWEDVQWRELYSDAGDDGATRDSKPKLVRSRTNTLSEADLAVVFEDCVKHSADEEGLRELQLTLLSAPSAEEVELLELSTDKVNTVCLWIIQGIIEEVRAKRLDTPPPIVTRVFNQLSDGMLGFSQAHKVAMVPFPFPFAQMVALLLVILYAALPLYIDLFTRNVFATPALSFVIPLAYCGLNRVAIELEEPFGTDWNDVDIGLRHDEFIAMLVDVLRQPTRPPQMSHHRMEEKILRGCKDNVSHPTHLAPELERWLNRRDEAWPSEVYSSTSRSARSQASVTLSTRLYDEGES